MLIVKDKPKSTISEAYRTLRTNIQFSNFDDDINTILVTSTLLGEGKTITAANLALSMAETEKKILIIDCDLRRPSLHKSFNISNAKGISNLLIGQFKFDDVAQKYAENLYILTSGTIPPNPLEMLSSNKMKIFLDEARNNFDLIILDTPPVMAVTDAQVLSTMVGGVLLVIAAGQTEIGATQKAVEQLRYAKANIIGVVLNKVELSGLENYHCYYGGSQSKSVNNHYGYVEI